MARKQRFLNEHEDDQSYLPIDQKDKLREKRIRNALKSKDFEVDQSHDTTDRSDKLREKRIRNALKSKDFDYLMELEDIVESVDLSLEELEK